MRFHGYSYSGLFNRVPPLAFHFPLFSRPIRSFPAGRHPAQPFDIYRGIHSIYPRPDEQSVHSLIRLPQQVFPSVSPDLFATSARQIRRALSEAELLVNRIATSKEYARRMMEAAQASQMDTVRKLIVSAGVRKDVRVSFNPDGITVGFSEQGCCGLSLFLRWK